VNLKVTGIRSESNEAKNAFLSVRGPKRVTAGDIVIPPSVKILDDSQYIVTIIQPISLNIESKIENSCRYRTEDFKGYQNGEFPVGAVPMPVRNVNYSVHPFESGVEMREISFMEIWTNGSLTPEEALFKASKKLIFLLNPFLHIRGSNIPNLGTNQNSSDLSKSFLQFDGVGKSKEILTNTFIDQLESPARAFNCLKRAEIHTINDLLKYSRDDLLKLKSSGKKSVDQVSKASWERFATELPGSEVRMD
jgi:DNA-directed RNA polymerase subunit alpha